MCFNSVIVRFGKKKVEKFVLIGPQTQRGRLTFETTFTSLVHAVGITYGAFVSVFLDEAVRGDRFFGHSTHCTVAYSFSAGYDDESSNAAADVSVSVFSLLHLKSESTSVTFVVIVLLPVV
jgi:hypothetical protein